MTGPSRVEMHRFGSRVWTLAPFASGGSAGSAPRIGFARVPSASPRGTVAGVPSEDTVRAEIEIDAPIEAVWRVLEDLERYAEWNPFTPRADSSLAIGDPIRFRVRLFGEQTIPWTERVTRNEPHTLGWELVLGHRRLLHAERTQVLTAVDSHRTHYLTEDRVSGILARLVLALFGGSMGKGFADCAQGLKKAVESR